MKYNLESGMQALDDLLAEAAALGIDPLVPWGKALFLMGLSRATGGRRRKKDPTFPPRIAIGENRWALRASTIRQWNDSRPTDREIAFDPPKRKLASKRIDAGEPKSPTAPAQKTPVMKAPAEVAVATSARVTK
jgi:predicted DNA-binding transcriptional regulator AlpA